MRCHLIAGIVLVCISLTHAEVKLTITREPLAGGEISPMQCGQFVEYLCDLVPGMWAEKLDDGGFDGLTPYKFVYIKETDSRQHPWYPSGATHRATFTVENGEQKIAVNGDTPATVGISQDGVSCAAGEEMIFSGRMRGPAVHVTLSRDGKVAAEAKLDRAGDWTKFSVPMKAADSIVEGTFSLHFRAPGTLWLDDLSLMPKETVGGWRPDVVRAVRELKPGIIRFGGSAIEGGELGDLEWRDLVGPAEKRKPFRAWGGLQPRAAGLEEFVQFCGAVDAEPLMCVRFNNRTPQDAAEQVEYFKRYHIKYWQVGNEIGNPEYAKRAGEFARAMRKVDPSIQIISSFPSAQLLEHSGDAFDFIAPHHYTRDLVGMDRDLTNLRAMIGDRKVKVAVTEWNTTAGDAGPARAMLWSLENALSCSRYHNLLHRHGDLVAIANRSNLCNSFCSGIIQTDRRGRLYKTPTYYAQCLYANFAGTKPLKMTNAPAEIDASATLSQDGHELALFVVNPAAKAVELDLDLAAFAGAEPTARHVLADRDRAGEPDATNSFADPTRVSVQESAARDDAHQRFDPLSLTVLRWKLPG